MLNFAGRAASDPLFSRFRKELFRAVAANFAAAALCLSVPASASVVSLRNPQMGEGGAVVALADVSGTGVRPYTALVGADAEAGGASVLTCYPERMELLSGGKSVQVRNSFGTAVCDVESGALRWTGGSESPARRSAPEAVSADGAWSAFVRRRDAVSGELVVRNVGTGETRVLDPSAEFGYRSVPALWSPEGSVLLYEKGGSVYFCEPSALFSGLQADERYRRLGGGGIGSVSWAGGGSIVRVSGDLVYRIDARQLHTRALYQPLVGSGSAVCRLPFAFDERGDRFWAAPDMSSFVLLTSGSVVSVYRREIAGDRFAPASVARLPDGRRVLDCGVLWSDGSPLLWATSLGSSAVYRIGQSADEVLSFDSSTAPALSPDGRFLASASGRAVFVRDARTMKIRGKLDGERVVSFAWSARGTLFVGGDSSVREWHVGSGSVRTLFLSSVRDAAWRNGVALAETEGGRYFEVRREGGAVSFRRVEFTRGEFERLARRIQNGRFRAYVGEGGGSLLVRDLSGPGSTRRLWSASEGTGGSGGREVRLAFDAVDSADGLDRILSVLGDYGIRATFFLNGEFIRRYPEETRKIAESGNVCASMFFAAADLAELGRQGYVIDEEFVRRGLSRNEDEFFAATGRELALFWHAPFYSAPRGVVQAGKKSGYEYVGATALDATTLEGAGKGGRCWSSAEIIAAAAADPPDVIPVSVGRPRGTRPDRLYEKLDLLVGELLAQGCEFVTF